MKSPEPPPKPPGYVKFGVVIVGDVPSTTLPLPVVAVTPSVPSPLDVVTIPLVVKLPSFLLVKLSEPARVARVPVVGSVSDVDAVVVNERAKLPAVVKLLARSILPANLIVLLALITSNVSVLSAVSAVEELDATNKSNAVVVVSRTSKVVKRPVDAVVAPMLILLIVPTPVEVNARVGVLLAVSVIKFV